MRHLTITSITTMCVLGTLTGCGSQDIATPPTTGVVRTTPTTVAADTVLLRYALWGGCNVAGPNCPVYTVHADGTVEVGRNTQGQPLDPLAEITTEVTGSIPAADLADWISRADAIDPEALAAEVGPGQCASCVDGADITVVVHPGTPDQLLLDSTVILFDPSHPLFASLDSLAAELADAAPLEIVWPEDSATVTS